METLTVRASSIPTSAAGRRRGPQATTGTAFAGRVLPGEGPVRVVCVNRLLLEFLA
jgi:hypothetical protein